jgi:hypothetical protein
MRVIGRLAVVARRPGKPGPAKVRVTQEDLAEEEGLHHAAQEALAAWRNKRKYIRDLLDSGAKVEPGIRVATVKRTTVLKVG